MSRLYDAAIRSASSLTRSRAVKKAPINTKSGLNYRPTLVSQTRYRTLMIPRRLTAVLRPSTHVLGGQRPGDEVVVLCPDNFDIEEAAPGNGRGVTLRQVYDGVNFRGLPGEPALEDQLVLGRNAINHEPRPF